MSLTDDLRRLDDELAWPETPDLASTVIPRLTEGRRTMPRRRLAIAVAAALLVPAAGALAFEDVREWLGLESVEVRRVPELPPGATQAPPNALGDSVTAEEAARRAGFRPVLPPNLGDPKEIRARRDTITVVYDGDLRLAQLQGALDRHLLTKIVGPGSAVREVPEGIFITGRHVYLYLGPDGRPQQARTAGNTLITQRGDLLLRLESRGTTLTYEQAARFMSRSG